MAGARVGCLGCLLWFEDSTNSRYFQWAMFGVCVGGLSGIMSCWQTYLMYRAKSQDPIKIALDKKREALCRKEQEVIER